MIGRAVTAAAHTGFARSRSEPDLPLPLLSEQSVPAISSTGLESLLRLLARWLVAFARKGPPVADSGPIAGAQNCLDVARDTEVVSDPETPEMPVQQAFQPGGRQ